MKRSLWTTLAAGTVLAMILTACGASPSPSAAPTATENPVAPQTNDFSFTSGDVIASAVVVPTHQAQMSFVISAPVKEILVKEGDVVKAGQPLIVLSTLDLELSVTEAEFGVRSAQLQLDRAYDPYKKIRNPDTLKVTYARAYVEKRLEMAARLLVAQDRLDAAKHTLAQGTLTAPFDGTVVDVIAEIGEVAQPGKVVIVLGDVANMQIETTDLSERDVPKVKTDQAATVYIKALDTTINGKVISISPISSIVGGDVVYKVKVALDEQPAGMLWGMSAEVHIQTAQ
jgi:RND family efflux transporter MFP subunit